MRSLMSKLKFIPEFQADFVSRGWLECLSPCPVLQTNTGFGEAVWGYFFFYFSVDVFSSSPNLNHQIDTVCVS